MTRLDLVEAAADNRKKVEMTLATAKKGKALTLTEVATYADLPASTAKRHLDQLVAIGRVHVETYGSFNIYQLNGVGAYTDKIHLSEDHMLLVDALTNRSGTPYIRLKESRRVHDGWKEIGAIVIGPEKVDELLEKLKTIRSNIARSKN